MAYVPPVRLEETRRGEAPYSKVGRVRSARIVLYLAIDGSLFLRAGIDRHCVCETRNKGERVEDEESDGNAAHR